MNAPFDHDRDLAGLDKHVDALRAASPDEQTLDDAQRRLMARLSNHAERAPRGAKMRAARWAPIGAAALLALALGVIVPLLTSPPALAFADVQRHFREFRTLFVTTTTRAAGGPALTTQVRADERGNVRVDVGDTLSVIVSADAKRTLHLLHGPRVARVEPLAAAPTRDDNLAWLEELRAFQGQATLLPETRTIAGEEAHGWQLEVQGMNATLWATAEGLPLEMEIANGTLVDIDFRFTFDAPLDAGTFSVDVPEGYRQ